MNVVLVYNDGLIESFDTREDATQEYTHSRLTTFVEEVDNDDDERFRRFRIGIELMPQIHSKSRDLPVTRVLCESRFESEEDHDSSPSFDVVCPLINGLRKLLVDGSVIWEGDETLYMGDDEYADITPVLQH